MTEIRTIEQFGILAFAVMEYAPELAEYVEVCIFDDYYKAVEFAAVLNGED